MGALKARSEGKAQSEGASGARSEGKAQSDGASGARSEGKAQSEGASGARSEGKAQSEGASGARSEGKAQSEGGSNNSSYRRKLAPFIFILGIVWPHNIIFFFLQSYATQRLLFLPRVFFIICCVMTKFTQIPQLLERCPCIEISLSFG